MTRIRYSVDNQVYTIIWKNQPGKLVVNMYILYEGVETRVKQEEIVEWLP